MHLRCAVLAGVLAMVPGVPSEDPAPVRAALETLHQAGLRRDASALEKIYAPEYFHTNADGSLMQREEVLASYRAPVPMTFSSSDSSEQKILVRNGYAVVTERLDLHGRTQAGEPFVSKYRVTYVLEREGPRWTFLNSHASLLGIDKHP